MKIIIDNRRKFVASSELEKLRQDFKTIAGFDPVENNLELDKLDLYVKLAQVPGILTDEKTREKITELFERLDELWESTN